jgi:hypothetical protein
MVIAEDTSDRPKGDSMSEEEVKVEEKQEPKAISTIERIQMLANMANGVQDSGIKQAFDQVKDGDKLYAIFADAVSREIENMMNPAQAAPKEMIDALAVTQSVRSQLAHMYSALMELNNTRLMGVLTMLNTSLGGHPIGQPPQAEQLQPQQPVKQAVRRVTDENHRAPMPRTSNTGIDW